MNETYKKLTDLIKKHNHIFIMAHKNIDLDALGSSICLYEIIKSFKKECYVIIDANENNTSITKATESMNNNNIDINYVTKETYNQYITSDSLVVVLDTHKKIMVECPTIFDEVTDYIVIDHHIKSGNHIENTIMSFINANLSSMNEFMVGYLKYLNKTVDPIIATIMLAGIEIDTNAFNVKTSVTTYEAAAILARMGADNIMKQELLQENKKIYMRRQKLINNSFKYNDIFEICILDNQIYERKDLALVSEQLLKFEDVEASFTIGKTDSNTIGVSARSLGRINVENYMAHLGGGGHMTDAAAQMIGNDIEEIKNLVLKIIDEVK